MTNFNYNHLSSTSKSSKNIANLAKGNYDLIITSASWDSRCMSIVNSINTSSDYAILVLYEKKDKQGKREIFDKELKLYLKKISKKLYSVVGDSKQTEVLWKKIDSAITNVYYKIGKPLKVLIDISTFPKYYSLAIISGFLKRGLVEQINILYAEGDYENSKKQEEEKPYQQYYENFTIGGWDKVKIPFLNSVPYVNKKEFYLVSVGFEGLKTRQVLLKSDPWVLSVLFPKPGFKDDYVNQALRENSKIFEQFNINEDDLICAKAGDAIAAWKKLCRNKNLPSPEIANYNLLCCGSKPHALGLALFALSLEHPTVWYRLPKEYNETDVRPNGTYWLYAIKDESVLI